MYYGICLWSIITPLSIQLFNLYGACGGTSRVRTPDEYYDLPGIYVAACEVIDKQIAIAQKVKEDRWQRRQIITR